MQFHLLFLYKIKVSKQNKQTHTYVRRQNDANCVKSIHTHTQTDKNTKLMTSHYLYTYIYIYLIEKPVVSNVHRHRSSVKREKEMSSFILSRCVSQHITRQLPVGWCFL
jgi:hypothetical protein